MVTVRRWWERYGVQAGLVAVAIGTALCLRQTQAGPLAEVYRVITQPLTAAKTMQQETLVNAQILELQQRLGEVQAENEKLQEMLEFRKSIKQKSIPAPVIGRSGDHWWQQATLGLGSNNGIAENQIVMAPGGVVGYVEGVTANTSRVLLVSDTNSQTGVMVSRSRATGYMRGIGNNRAVMEFFSKVPDVRKGDSITISNLSKKYPKGLPVGRVESVDLYKSPAPEATIELSAPIRSLEWVLVYPSPPILDQTPEAKPGTTPEVNSTDGGKIVPTVPTAPAVPTAPKPGKP
jgi:rod shape-determining protein MreC